MGSPRGRRQFWRRRRALTVAFIHWPRHVRRHLLPGSRGATGPSILPRTHGRSAGFVSSHTQPDARGARRIRRLSVTPVRRPKRSDCSASLRTVATPAKDTVRRQEFAELAGRSPTGAPDVSFRSVATIYRNELSDEVMDKTLDRLSEARAETVLGITHYMHGEVCRVTPDATAFPLRQSGGIHIRIGLAIGTIPPRQPTSHALGRRSASAAAGPRPANGFMPTTRAMPARARLEAVFGSNLPRLVALKNKYDPDQFLSAKLER